MKIVVVYSFNDGQAIVQTRYSKELKQIFKVIAARKRRNLQNQAK